MKNENLKGVYSIQNNVDGKQYIGSTTVSFKDRIDHHINGLRVNRHKNKHLQNSWNKYGEDCFTVRILEVVDDSDDVLKREQDWIDSIPFDELFNINPLATGGNQFPEEVVRRRAKTSKLRYAEIVKVYEKWKNGEIGDDELTSKEVDVFNRWVSPPWNKGIKYDCTEHLKVPKRRKGDRTKDIETKRNNLPSIEVYTINGEYIRSFRSSKDLEEWSETEQNNLPISSRFTKPRMGKNVKFLQSSGINKSCRTGKPYKNLIFKFETKAPPIGDNR